MKYKIEKGIPTPQACYISWRHELENTMRQMEVGDSFWCEKNPHPLSTLGFAVFYAKREMKINQSLEWFIPIHGWRIWRIE